MMTQSRIPWLVSLWLLASGSAVLAQAPAPAKTQEQPNTQAVGPYKDFKGVINLDVRDSKAD